MKVILEFDGNEDFDLIQIHNNAVDVSILMSEVMSYLTWQIKHGDGKYLDTKTVETIKEYIITHLDINNVLS